MGRKRHSILRRELGNSRGMERLEHVDHSYMQANLHMQFRRHIAARTSLLLLLHCERDRRRRGGGGGKHLLRCVAMQLLPCACTCQQTQGST